MRSSAPDFGSAASHLAVLADGDTMATNLASPPEVSVVLPVYGQLAYTLNCLDSLYQHRSAFSFEIIVVDVCSTDETEAHLKDLRGIRYIRQPENGREIG